MGPRVGAITPGPAPGGGQRVAMPDVGGGGPQSTGLNNGHGYSLARSSLSQVIRVHGDIRDGERPVSQQAVEAAADSEGTWLSHLWTHCP